MAVTLLIVSIGLVLVLQGLTTAKFSAAETHYRKVARELALLTLGQVEAGLYWEDLDGTQPNGERLTGTYAEEDYEEFSYEIALGEEDFQEADERYDRGRGYHDTWQYEEEREDRAREGDDDEEEIEEPFEKVKIRVYYPKLGERPNSLVLERWMPWDQVYGNDDGEDDSTEGEQ